MTGPHAIQEPHDIVVWGKVGPGRHSRVTVDGVVIPGVDRVRVRNVTPEEDDLLPARPRPILLDVIRRQAYEVVLTFVEDQEGTLWQASQRAGDGQPVDIKPLRPTATMDDLDGKPLNRDEYAADLEKRWNAEPDRRSLVIAALLDELAGVYPGEPLGALARQAAVHLYDRAGV